MTTTLNVDASELKTLSAFRDACTRLTQVALEVVAYLVLGVITLGLSGILIPQYFDASALGFLAGYVFIFGRTIPYQRRFRKAASALADELGDVANSMLKEPEFKHAFEQAKKTSRNWKGRK